MCRRISCCASACRLTCVCFSGKSAPIEALECCSEWGEAGHFDINVSNVDVAGNLGQVHVLHGGDSTGGCRGQAALSKEKVTVFGKGKRILWAILR